MVVNPSCLVLWNPVEVETFSLAFYRQDFDLRQQSQWSLEKAAKIWGHHHWFPRKMTVGNDCRNFILTTSCVTTQV